MTIRVLHIFAPNFRQRFGGPVFNWQLYFSRWDDASVEHLVLDTEASQILPAKAAFDFEMKGPQKVSGRWQRWVWAIRMLQGLRVNQGQYDLIHFHLIWWGSLMAARWARRKHIPTIYESVLLDSDTPGAIGKEHLGKIKLHHLHQFNSILAISNGIAQDYLDHGFSSDQVHMQMNALDTDLFKPLTDLDARNCLRSNFKLPSEALVLLFTGSLIKRKGVDLLIEAFIDVAQNDPNLFLWLVGPKDHSENPSLDESFVTMLEQKVAQAGISEQVSFYGMIGERNKLAKAYQAADVFVFPSRKEGLPNVVLEAMACGLPVIVSDLPGLRHVIVPNETGFVIPGQDAQALVKQILHVAENPGEARLVGQRAFAYIQAGHGFRAWQKNMSTYYHLLSR